MSQIRSITPSDISILFQIESEIHSHPWTKGMFEDCFKSASQDLGYSGFILENEQNKPCAYLVIQTILDECHILTIGVKKEYQNQGYASQLVQYLFDTHSPRRFLLEVRESNQPAINLYQKLGFQCIAERKNYYFMPNNHRENALIFEKIDDFETSF